MRIKRLPVLACVVLVAAFAVSAQEQPNASRLQQHVSYLASDALDGRRTGTRGAEDAAHYLAGEFARAGLLPVGGAAGLKPSRLMARYLQLFPYVGSVELGKENVLALTAGTVDTQTLRVGEDWMPLGFSSNQKIAAAEIVFAGYGISSSELNYNDYKGKFTKGQIAVVFAGTPDGDNPHGSFARAGDVRFKVAAARNAGVGALLIIAQANKLSEDGLAQLRYDNNGEAGIPVAVISRETAAKILGASSLGDYEDIADVRKIGEGSITKAAVLRLPQKGRSLTLATDVVRKEVPSYNVVGVLEGSDPVLKKENIIIGAHYDHLGRGGEGSLAPRSGEIHHGADDNASGTAGLLELARIFGAQKPKLKRTLIFVAFSGEEEGLLGSNYYVNHTAVPLSNTVAMINMDMIGRMKDRKLIIGGVGTAKEWRDMISQANTAQTMQVTAKSDSPTPKGMPIVVSANGRPIMSVDPKGAFDLTLTEDGFGPSDHSSFYGKQVPVLFFWTGTHNDYHKPSDTFDKINYTDEARILIMVARIVRDLGDSSTRPTYTTAKADNQQRTGFRVYLGTIPNYADSNNGLLLDGVRDDSPAAKAGLKAGDRVVKIGEREIKNVYDYTYALGEMKAGQEYGIEVVRGSEKLSLKITPAARN